MQTVQLNVQVLSALAGLWIPLVTGLVTKKVAHSALKAVINALLSAVAGGVAVAIQAQGKVSLGVWVYGIATAWVVSLSTYAGFWKPTGAADAVQEKTANIGLG